MDRRNFLGLSFGTTVCTAVNPSYALSQESDVKKIYDFVKDRGRVDVLKSLSIVQHTFEAGDLTITAYMPVDSSARFSNSPRWTKPVLFVEKGETVLRDYGLDGMILGEDRYDYFEQGDFRFIGDIDKCDGTGLTVDDAMDMLPEAKRRYAQFLSEVVSDLGI
tara:strand:- start:5169 stop:5657 length:489 start_codon:yes stop_codon:yes gene_type:complete